jgi:hypothetical protein
VSRAAPAALRGFLAAYDPGVAKLFLATRRAVLAAAPRANELIYDAYNAVSCAYSFSDRLKDAFCHVAAYPRHVNLGFNRGAELADPARRLAGTGTKIRHVRIAAAADLKEPALAALLRAAVQQGHALHPPADARGTSIIVPVAGKKRRPGRR